MLICAFVKYNTSVILFFTAPIRVNTAEKLKPTSVFLSQSEAITVFSTARLDYVCQKQQRVSSSCF